MLWEPKISPHLKKALDGPWIVRRKPEGFFDYVQETLLIYMQSYEASRHSYYRDPRPPFSKIAELFPARDNLEQNTYVRDEFNVTAQAYAEGFEFHRKLLAEAFYQGNVADAKYIRDYKLLPFYRNYSVIKGMDPDSKEMQAEMKKYAQEDFAAMQQAFGMQGDLTKKLLVAIGVTMAAYGALLKSAWKDVLVPDQGVQQNEGAPENKKPTPLKDIGTLHENRTKGAAERER